MKCPLCNEELVHTLSLNPDSGYCKLLLIGDIYRTHFECFDDYYYLTEFPYYIIWGINTLQCDIYYLNKNQGLYPSDRELILSQYNVTQEQLLPLLEKLQKLKVFI